MCAGSDLPSLVGMRRLGVPLVLVLLVLVGGCAVGGPPPDHDPDRVAQVIALAIDSPRQDDAVGYARAAMDTRAARDGRLAVVWVSTSHLVLRVHFEAFEDTSFFTFERHVPEVFACYDVQVGRSGIEGEPTRRTCPVGASPVQLPPPRGTLAPEVRMATQGSDAGVSVRGEDACLLGSRIEGEVLVWRPSRVQVQPGELSCDPATALGRMGIDPPH
jgi:hypothetical protein